MRVRWVVASIAAVVAATTLTVVPWTRSGDQPPVGRSSDASSCAPNDGECWFEGVLVTAVEDGPAAALREYQALTDRLPYMKVACHSHYERIGRAVALASDALGHREAGCQFGYLHGVLYAVGEKFTDVDELMTMVLEYCVGYEDDGTTYSPRSSCYHGAGHAAAEVTFDDPLAAIRSCVEIPESHRLNCADGVLMEYGDDHLKRVGFLYAGTALADDRGTESDPAAIRALCPSVPAYASFACFARLWKFTVDGYAPDVSVANELCGGAVEVRDREGCFEGFGELAAKLELVDKPWPPADPSSAAAIAVAVAGACAGMDIAASCLNGAIGSMNSHLYAAGTDESLIPDVCAHVAPSLREECATASENARSHNWALVNGEPTSDAP